MTFTPSFNPSPKPEPKVKEKKSPKEKKPRSKLSPKNKERKAKRFISDFGGTEYHAYIVSLPCDCCGVSGITAAAHLTTRGAGGKAEDCAPLCCQSVAFKKGIVRDSFCHQRYDAHDPEIRKQESRLRELAKARRSAFTFAMEHAA